MNCETAQQQIILETYGELPDDQVLGLERHLEGCEDCRQELAVYRSLEAQFAVLPIVEPSPNLLAQSRMRLDEALDAIPAHGFWTRLRANGFKWFGHLQSAPALATLLVGLGFLGGNFLNRYQVANTPRTPEAVTLMNSGPGTVSSISGIVQTPNSEIVQVNYNKVVPESVQGSLDDPHIRQLLMMATNLPVSNGVRADSVSLLASECNVGHHCSGSSADAPEGQGIRSALLVSLRYDKSAQVRLKALQGLAHYVGQDQRVRDAVLEALMHDRDAQVRSQAVDLLEPVQSDSSVRQVLRTVSTQDANPYVRTASFNALQNTSQVE